MRLVVGLIAFSMFLSNRGYAEQSPERVVQVAAVPQGRYVPLQTLLDRRDGVPAALERRVTVQRQSELLQNVLVEVANQAGLGLSYSDEVAKSQTRVSIDAVRATAADVLIQVVKGTLWRVLVTPQGQVTVVRAPRTGSIVGQVTDTTNGLGVRGAEVLLEGTRWRTETDTAGRYRLSEVDVGTYTLTARRPGYMKQSRQVIVGEGVEETVNIALPPRALELDEVVATATGPQRRREIANAVTTIKADSVLQTAPIRNLTDLLEGRVLGMTASRTSGAPGDPSRLRLRGLGSVLRSNDPVVIVDGVRVYAVQTGDRAGNLAASGTAVPSPLDQIDPNMIETVEVFKGPSAATLYGADAANGVIVITTKKGRPGPTQWQARAEYGRTYTIGRYPEGLYRWGSNSITNASALCLSILDRRCETQDSVVRQQLLNDPAFSPLGEGNLASVTLSASGGTSALTYSFTGSYADETGLLRLPSYEVERFRARFGQEPPDWMMHPHGLEKWSVTSSVQGRLSSTADVSAMTSLTRSEQSRTDLEQRVTGLVGTYVDTVNGRYYTGTGGTSGYGFTEQVLEGYYNQKTTSSLTFTAGLSANWRPASWFDGSANAGLNVVPRNDESFIPTGLITTDDNGRLAQGSGRSVVSTFNVQGRVRRQLGLGFLFTTSVGVNITSTSTTDVSVLDSILEPGTREVSGNGGVSGDRLETSVYGWYIEPRLVGRRFSLSTGLRLDGGSSYGARVSSSGLIGLPKLGGAWVISEEPWFPFTSVFSSLKLRGAYGQAQVQPGPEDRLRLYEYSTLDGSPVSLITLGNSELRPERSTEFEGGFDADMLDGRFKFEFTAYRKKTIDALLGRQLPSSIGGGETLQNIGNVLNTGIEIETEFVPIRTSAVTWSAAVLYSRNNNTLTELGSGVAEDRTQGIVEGYPVGGRWAKPIIAFSDQNGNGVLDLNEFRIGDTAVFLGRLLPEYTTSFVTNASFFGGTISLSAGFSYESGATQVDDAVYANAAIVPGIVDPNSSLSEQVAVLAALNINPDGAIGRGAGDATDYGITNDVSTFRFKTLAIWYRAPRDIARLVRAQELSVALQGNNLGLHSNYRGKDPNVGASISGEGIRDTGQLPLPRTWQIAFSLRY